MHLVIVPLTGTGVLIPPKIDDSFRPDLGVSPPVFHQANGVLAEKGYVAVWVDEDAAAFDARRAKLATIKVLYRDAQSSSGVDKDAARIAAAIDDKHADDLPQRKSKAVLLAEFPDRLDEAIAVLAAEPLLETGHFDGAPK